MIEAPVKLARLSFDTSRHSENRGVPISGLQNTTKQTIQVNPTDDEFKELYQSILPDGGGRGVAPPLIVWGKHRLLQADVILEYLAAEPGDGVPPLLPPDPYAAARVRLFCSVFLSHVPPALHKVLLCEGKQARAEAEAALMTALAQVDAFLQLHGGFTEGESAVGPHHEFVMSPSEVGAPRGRSERGVWEGGGRVVRGACCGVS